MIFLSTTTLSLLGIRFDLLLLLLLLNLFCEILNETLGNELNLSIRLLFKYTGFVMFEGVVIVPKLLQHLATRIECRYD